MLDFPKSTLFNKRIPKQKFYQHLELSSGVERQFVQEIETIFWKNKLSVETLNVGKGSAVTEIEVFEIQLKEQAISKNLIEVIDREIPYHLVFVLRYMELGQIWISYKEESKNRQDKFKVNSYYTTPWMEASQLSLTLDGLNLDTIYNNFIRQVAGQKLQDNEGTEIKVAIDHAKETEKLKTAITTLESKILNEKQFNLQVRWMGRLRKLKAQLNEIE